MESLFGFVVSSLLGHENADIGMGRGGAACFRENLETLGESPLARKDQSKIGKRLLVVRINRQGLAERPLGFGEVIPLVVVVS